mmetsp:Transcript_25396/g.22541  ORF Transcript_25396/g.22541 Transcript_25396/m.22541 type:complete len:214 (+) Transcript_25396:279-920(+)
MSLISTSVIDGFNESIDTPKSNNLRTIKEAIVHNNSANRQNYNILNNSGRNKSITSSKSKTSRSSKSSKSSKSSSKRKKFRFKRSKKNKFRKIKARVLKQALNRRGFKQTVPTPTGAQSPTNFSIQTPSTMVHLPKLNDDESNIIPDVYVSNKSGVGNMSQDDSKFSIKSDRPKVRYKSTNPQSFKKHSKPHSHKSSTQNYTVNYKMNIMYKY